MADLVAKLGADTSQLQSEIGKAKKSLQGYKSEVDKLSTAEGKQQSAIDKARAAISKQANSYSQAASQARTLRSGLKEMLFQYNQLDSKAKNSSFGKNLKKDIEAAKQKVDQLASSMDKVDEKLGKKRSFSIGGKGGDLLQGMQGQLGQVGSIMSQIGPAIANPYVAAGAAIVACGAGVANLSAKINEQINEVQKLTGASQEASESMRAGISAVSSVYDTDFNETLRATNSLAQSMGISFEDATDLLSQGLASTSLESGEFLSQIKEYAPVLAEAGISGAGLIDVMNAAAQAGIPADKAVDALKEGMLSLREMTPATAAALEGIGINAQQMQQDIASGSITSAEAMQQILTKCNALGMGSQEVGTIMADVFRGAGEDAGKMLPTLAKINLSEQELSTPLTEYGQKQEALREATQEWEAQMSTLFSNSSGGFKGIVTDIKTGVLKGFTAMIVKVKELINWWIDGYNKSLLVRGALATFKSIFISIGKVGVTAIKSVVNGFKGLAQVMKGILTWDWDLIKEGAADVMSTLKDFTPVGLAKMVGQGIKDGFSEGFKDIDKKIPKIKIKPEIVPPALNTPATEGTGTGKGTGKVNTGKGAGKSKAVTKEDTTKSDIMKMFNKSVIHADNSGKSGKSIENNDSQSMDMRAQISTFLGDLDARGISSELSDYLKELFKNVKTPEEYNKAVETANDFAGREFADNDNQRKKKLYDEKNSRAEKAQMDFFNGDISADQYRGIIDGIQKELEANEIEIPLKVNVEDDIEKKVHGIGDAVNTVTGSFAQIGEAIGVPELAIPQLVGEAIGNIVKGFGTASASAGSMGPWAWIAFIASGLATVAMTVSQIKNLTSGSYASGGIIQGATSIGDYNLARVNGGEMILNGTQQSRLFNLLDGNGALGKSSSVSGNVDFRIKGKNLVGTLGNYSKRQAKL